MVATGRGRLEAALEPGSRPLEVMRENGVKVTTAEKGPETSSSRRRPHACSPAHAVGSDVPKGRICQGLRSGILLQPAGAEDEDRGRRGQDRTGADRWTGERPADGDGGGIARDWERGGRRGGSGRRTCSGGGGGE